jgi:hypothetical protein
MWVLALLHPADAVRMPFLAHRNDSGAVSKRAKRYGADPSTLPSLIISRLGFPRSTWILADVFLFAGSNKLTTGSVSTVVIRTVAAPSELRKTN